MTDASAKPARAAQHSSSSASHRFRVPAKLLYPYGVTAALIALFLHDEKIRSRALAALRGLPAAAVESDQNIESYLAALHDKEWDKQVG